MGFSSSSTEEERERESESERELSPRQTPCPDFSSKNEFSWFEGSNAMIPSFRRNYLTLTSGNFHLTRATRTSGGRWGGGREGEEKVPLEI